LGFGIWNFNADVEKLKGCLRVLKKLQEINRDNFEVFLNPDDSG
jgi:hypothetical protein